MQTRHLIRSLLHWVCPKYMIIIIIIIIIIIKFVLVPDNSNDKTSVLCVAFSQCMTCPLVAYRDYVF